MSYNFDDENDTERTSTRSFKQKPDSRRSKQRDWSKIHDRQDGKSLQFDTSSDSDIESTSTRVDVPVSTVQVGSRQLPLWLQDAVRAQSEKGPHGGSCSQLLHKRPEPEPALIKDVPANGEGATSSSKKTKLPEFNSKPSVVVSDLATSYDDTEEATSSTKSDDKTSDSPVEMTSNGSDNESTSNSSENNVSDVPEEHVLRIHVFPHERRGYVEQNHCEYREDDHEYRVEINRKHLEDWRNGIDPYAPKVQVDLPEGQCWNCGGTFWPHGLSCRCSDDVRANRPGPEPRVCTNYWPKQFTYEGERFGHRIPTTPLMEKHREEHNQLLFQEWYRMRCME